MRGKAALRVQEGAIERQMRIEGQTVGYSDSISSKIEKRGQHRLVIALAIAALCFGAILLASGCSCSQSGSGSQSGSQVIDTLDTKVTPSASSESSQAEKPTIPVDFPALQEQNRDVYAWIYMPNTAVNHPVLQSSLVDNYYLVHDVYGNDSELGALYTQSVNSRGFHDPVTIIYGHTFESGGVVGDQMFGTLHNYEDPQFFNDNPTFYIYTPTSILTYEVVSAYEYDSRHILNSYDFNNTEVAQAYFDYVLNPDSMAKNVREHERLEAGKDHIVQLSTCTHPPNDNARYLVTGVLVDEQQVQ
jgi:sortase B